jgi:hypothetical protein
MKIQSRPLLRYSSLIYTMIFFSCISIYGQPSDFKNDWIDYSKSYLRIGVKKTGIQRVLISSLPSMFASENPARFQLWHRGKEISIIKANDTEILFYGEVNDGISDTLVFRPASSRLNPYVSLFSDEGSYFLTVSDKAKRAVSIDGTNVKGDIETFHHQKEVVSFTNQFAFTTFGVGRSLNNSFYDQNNSWTGTTLVGPNAVFGEAKDTELIKDIQLRNWVQLNDQKPTLEIMVNGLYEGAHNIQIHTGRDKDNLRNVGAIQFTSWGGHKFIHELNSSDIDEAGVSCFKLMSLTTNTSDWYGLTYFTISYPQKTDMDGQNEMIFNFRHKNANQIRIGVNNPPTESEIYEISDTDNPKRIIGKNDTKLLESMIHHGTNNNSRVLISSPSAYVNVDPKQLHNVDFKPVFAFPAIKQNSKIDPRTYDYLIITSDGLTSGAIEYADYRSSAAGGRNNTLLVNIRSIYDQFNYGEPSPVAIRHYINYMLREGIRDSHSLFLIGNSVSYPARMVKEMPGEVPTFGDPGSDILLVAGLAGTNADVPAIPVGRINAFSPIEVRDYLTKVKTYESNVDFSWKKNVLHLNGGHSGSEISQLKGILSDLSPIVENGELGGNVRAFVKQNPGQVEKVNITPEVNAGVGLITYFGHGSQTITDLDMGYVSDGSKGYANSGKYPVMYFNGCGVGNIFTNRTTHLLSGNWLMSPNRGAIAIISNSSDSYITSSQRHLKIMYNHLFVQNPYKSIGQIIKEVALEVVKGGTNMYDVANLHQFYLHGDPALKLLSVDKPDYSMVADESIFIQSAKPNAIIGESESLNLKVIVANLGKFDKGRKIPIEITYTYKNGSNSTRLVEMNPVASKDTLSFEIDNVVNIRNIQVNIDKYNTIRELSKDNNYSELLIDWEVAKFVNFYPSEKVKDIVAPKLVVTFNGRQIENGEVLGQNPEIVFKIDDDRYLSMLDTNILNVYIKDCFSDDCDFKRLKGEKAFTFERVSNSSIKVTYLPAGMFEGDYQLLVTAKDNSENAISKPYVVSFTIRNGNMNKLDLVVSPNPSTDYFKFKLNNYLDLTTISWFIYDINGNAVASGTIQNPRQDSEEWYWFPKNHSGLYIYRVISTDINGDKKDTTGKVIVVK